MTQQQVSQGGMGSDFSIEMPWHETETGQPRGEEMTAKATIIGLSSA